MNTRTQTHTSSSIIKTAKFYNKTLEKSSTFRFKPRLNEKRSANKLWRTTAVGCVTLTCNLLVGSSQCTGDRALKMNALVLIKTTPRLNDINNNSGRNWRQIPSIPFDRSRGHVRDRSSTCTRARYLLLGERVRYAFG